MRLPLTDKFLLDLYNFLETTGKSFDFAGLRTMKEASYPELYKLRRQYERRRNREQVNQLISYLKKKGYIKIKNLEGKEGIILTNKGFDKALIAKFKTKNKKIRKDGKWQMIIFDIPEKKRKLRHLLREHLCYLGYKMLQQSVWVCPYEVKKESESFLAKYNLDKYVKVFLINEI